MNKTQLITLTFRIGSETENITNVNLNQPLSVSVKKALKNHGREIGDWIVTFNGNQLDTSKKVEELGLANNDLLKLTLRDGGGGCN
ncbi:DUF2604 domain-containing protein [Marivirga salinae]|uniref:DUF2604 domain-containing protein n=1 Tax=Marivirga salinarum TaxID=3059078 RepID=A0AA51NBU8_9BACT|nr:DUF2604 domain-containing protein [Marivirga sp. BDSF4-3]WMN12114.1 DUF2604 domain-containing protein [Marivirga sp. BDSF4-3]